jgi:hypothetical protein
MEHRANSKSFTLCPLLYALCLLDSGSWPLTPLFFRSALLPVSLKASWPIGLCSCLFRARLSLFFRSSSLVLLNGHHIAVNGYFHPFVRTIYHRLVHGQTVPGKKEHFLRRPPIRIVLTTIKLELPGKNDGLDNKVTGRGWNCTLQPFLNLLLHP